MFLSFSSGLEHFHWGKGFTGATIKDTRTKSRGRVQVVEGGGIGWGGWREGEKMQTIVTE